MVTLKNGKIHPLGKKEAEPAVTLPEILQLFCQIKEFFLNPAIHRAALLYLNPRPFPSLQNH